MAYYGFEHRYGATMHDSDGDRIGRLVIFPTKRGRDAWVEKGNPYFTNPGAREAVTHRFAARWQRISASVTTFREGTD